MVPRFVVFPGKKSEDKCPACDQVLDSHHLIWCKDGRPRCPETGVVLEEFQVHDMSPRICRDMEERNNLLHTEVVTNPDEPRTLILKKELMQRPSAREGNQKSDWERRIKLAHKNSSTRQSNLRKARKIFRRLKGFLHLPSWVRKTADLLYSRIQRELQMSGRTIEQYVVISIYFAGKIDRYPVFLQELVTFCRSERTDLKKAYQDALMTLPRHIRVKIVQNPKLSDIFARVRGCFSFTPLFESLLDHAFAFLDKRPRILPQTKPINIVGGVITYFSSQARSLGDVENFITQESIIRRINASLSGIQQVKKELVKKIAFLEQSGFPVWDPIREAYNETSKGKIKK